MGIEFVVKDLTSGTSYHFKKAQDMYDTIYSLNGGDHTAAAEMADWAELAGVGDEWEAENIKVSVVDLEEAQEAQPQKTAESLPDLCWSVLPTDGKLICIKRGESGYYPSDWNTSDPQKNRETADFANESRGITKAQEKAMVAGSMYGWDVPGADPAAYDEQGKLKPDAGVMKQDLFTMACAGDISGLESFYKMTHTANVTVSKFGKEHSLVMGAFRNNQWETVDWLLDHGALVTAEEKAEIDNQFYRSEFIQKMHDRGCLEQVDVPADAPTDETGPEKTPGLSM